ncbi:hypothetical protein V2J09_000754 [Rumex salicifolius]
MTINRRQSKVGSHQSKANSQLLSHATPTKVALVAFRNMKILGHKVYLFFFDPPHQMVRSTAFF